MSTLVTQLRRWRSRSSMPDSGSTHSHTPEEILFEDISEEDHDPFKLLRSRSNSFDNSVYSDTKNSIDDKRISNYDKVFDYLPVLIVLIPSLLRVLEIKGLIRNNSSTKIMVNKIEFSSLSIDLFAILIIAWIVKFLHDWPRSWHYNTRIIFEKFQVINTEFEGEKPRDAAFLKKLNYQYYSSLLLCFMSPLLSSFLFNYFNSIHEEGIIFTDLNVLIFIMFEQVLNLISFTEEMKKYTYDIELDLSKLINNIVSDHGNNNNELINKEILLELNNSKNNENLAKIEHLEIDLSKQKELIDINHLNLLKFIKESNNEMNLKLNSKLINKFNKFEEKFESKLSFLQQASINPVPIFDNNINTTNIQKLNPIVELAEESAPLNEKKHHKRSHYRNQSIINSSVKSFLPTFKLTTGDSSNSTLSSSIPNSANTTLDSNINDLVNYSDNEDQVYCLINDSNVTNSTESNVVTQETDDHGSLQFLQFSPFRNFHFNNNELINREHSEIQVISTKHLGVKQLFIIIIKVPMLMNLILWEFFFIKPMRFILVFLSKIIGVNLFDDE